jgi:hypothetical protein
VFRDLAHQVKDFPGGMDTEAQTPVSALVVVALVPQVELQLLV